MGGGGATNRGPEIILVGFQLSKDTEVLLSCVFSLLYIFNLLANGVILGLIWLDLRLHSPMYFFLSHLAIIDICYASSSSPNMLEKLIVLLVTCAGEECPILVVMAYDGFAAICHPPQYTVIMNWTVCMLLVIAIWACGFSLALVHVILSLRLTFSGPQEVNHFFWEILSILKVACGDTWINEVFVFAGAVFILVGPLSPVLICYVHILWAILKIQTKEGRRKAFSTCSSHFCVVGFYFGIAMMVDLVPDNSQREEQQKNPYPVSPLFNPLLNPLIYSLRNAQMKAAFNRALQKKRAI
ncbi:LOW QUALITY PROTEIN: olfactory receptor 2A2-like [Panthera onca]